MIKRALFAKILGGKNPLTPPAHAAFEFIRNIGKCGKVPFQKSFNYFVYLSRDLLDSAIAALFEISHFNAV